MIPDSFLEELKYRLDAEEVIAPYTRLKRSGRNLVGLCPFHSEKSPSFFVYPENNSFYCFGCGAGGDLISFIRRAENLDYVEAVKFLADRAGLPMPEDAGDDETGRRRRRILEINRESARFFHATLTSPAGKAGLDYLTRRGLPPNIIRRFGLGYAPDSWDTLKRHLLEKGFSERELIDAGVCRQRERGGSYDYFRGRVMFPIIDLRGGVVGFGGRTLGDAKPKYLNTNDTLVFKKSRGLFAMNLAKSTKEPNLILCEGYMDAISIHQGGFDNAVASCGTALTPEQARLLSQYTNEVVVAYDSDGPGQEATRRAVRIFGDVGVKVRVLTVTGAKDPDEFLKKYGAARFRELLTGSANSTEYAINRLQSRYNILTDDGKVGFLREFCALMAQIPDRIEADVYITRMARELSVSREAIVGRVESLRRQNRRREEKKFDASLRIFAQEEPGRQRDPQRAANLRYALAEDKLIGILLRNPDFGPEITAEIKPEEFVTETNRGIYTVLSQRIAEGRAFDAMSLSGSLDDVQMSRISYLTVSNAGQGFTLEDARAQISVIKEKQQEKTSEQVGAMSEDELRAYIGGIAAKKNPAGGNRHG